MEETWEKMKKRLEMGENVERELLSMNFSEFVCPQVFDFELQLLQRNAIHFPGPLRGL